MRRATGLSFIVLAVSTVALADTPPPKKPTSAALVEHSKLLAPIQVESLTLTPIISTDEKVATDNLLVLDEAMPKKLVRIHEVDESGSVNSLTLTNKSDQPLFLLAGEVILGGKQDRIIGSNTIVPPKKTLEVPVYCVEHGRWDGKTTEFTTAKALAHGRLRGKANFEGQSEVWAEVASKNSQRKTTNATDTYRQVAVQSPATGDSWQKQIDGALAKLGTSDQERLVGFAVSLNGKVASVDVFNSPVLFKKLQAKLVRSYITEAVDVKTEKAAKPPTTKDVKAFIDDAEQAKEEAAYETDYAASAVKKGGVSSKARVMFKAPPPAAGHAAAKPAEDKPVFETYQGK